MTLHPSLDDGGCGGGAPLFGPGATGCEHLIGPAVVNMLSDKVGLVSPVVLTSPNEARSQSLQMLKPVGPLSLTKVRHELSPANRRKMLGMLRYTGSPNTTNYRRLYTWR